MGLSCKLAGIRYDLEHKYPVLRRLECRLCTVEWELNKDNPCVHRKKGGDGRLRGRGC